MSNIGEILDQKTVNDILTSKIRELRDQLNVLSFDKLYKLYDVNHSQIDSKKESNEMKQILKDKKISKQMSLYHRCCCKALKQVVENKQITESEKSEWIGIPNQNPFFDFPEKNEKKFNEEIYLKKEFRMYELHRETAGIQNKCDNLTFETAPHQLFLKNFMNKESPYKGLLLFHGVGVGKTCSAITIAESFRDVFSRKEKRSIILSSKNIQIGWKKTIFNPGLKEEQCTGKVFLNRNIKTKRELTRLVKEYYELMAYQSFGNFVKRLIQSSKMKYPSYSQEELERTVIQDYFSERLFIIDEVHNLRDESESDKDLKNSVLMIQKVLKYSQNMRLVLLSATPMYNRSTEIVPLLNLLLMNDKRELIHQKDIFTKDGSLTKKGTKSIQSVSRGYVSYLRGEDPNTFPVRLYPNELVGEDQSFYPYKSTEAGTKVRGCIINPNKSPQDDLFDKKILEHDKLKFLELYGSPLNDYHKFIYDEAEKRILKKYDLKEKKDILQIQDNNVLSQISNMVYPNSSGGELSVELSAELSREGSGLSRAMSVDSMESGDIDPFRCYGERGLKNSFTKKVKGNKVEYKYKPHLIGDSKQRAFLDNGDIKNDERGELMNYSSKISALLDLIEKTDGIIFIYSYWIKSGVIPLVLALEQNGHKKFSGETILNYPEWNKTKDKNGDKNMKREPLSFEGHRRSKVQGEFHQSRYMVIAGDNEKLSANMEEELKIATDPENIDGKDIKIIIGSVVASEGMDFKRIRSLHILEPWLHLNRIEQTIGRGIRFCSHGDLDDDKKNVMIYLHSTYNHGNKETIDALIYRYAEKKAIHIGEIEDILKREAIDRFLFREANVILSKNVSLMNVQAPLKDSKMISLKPYDKPYSKICSFLPKCNYNSDLTKPGYNSLLSTTIDHCDTSTISYEYSENLIVSVQKKISELFQEMSIYSLDSIVGLLKDYYKLDLPIIYLSLQRMLDTKFPVFNKERELGYLFYSGYHYLFQPLLINDESIPLYYRTYPEVKITDEFFLPKSVQKKDTYSSSLPKSVDETTETTTRGIYQMIAKHLEEFHLKEFLQSLPDHLDERHPICYAYEYDRLTFEERYHLMITYLSDIHIHKEIDLLLEEQVIYSKDGELYFSQMIKDKTLKSYKKCGFYVVYNNFPQFFTLTGNEFTEMNDLDIKDLLQSLTHYSTTLPYKQRYENKLPYGYPTKRKRSDPTKREQTVLKFNRDNYQTKKGQYPPGPGNICIDNSQGFQKKDLENYLKTNFSELMQVCLRDDQMKDEYDDKKIMCDILEIILRYINFKEKNKTFFSYDDIWIKFPPFN